MALINIPVVSDINIALVVGDAATGPEDALETLVDIRYFVA